MLSVEMTSIKLFHYTLADVIVLRQPVKTTIHDKPLGNHVNAVEITVFRKFYIKVL